MITAWRIVQIEQKNNAFTGEGARIYSGRWNNKGVALVYTSSTISLASMEILVNLPSASLLENYVRIAVDFEEDLVEELKELPKKWNSRPLSPATKKIGDQWVRENRSAILKVPSVVVPAEDNYLLNPNHPDWPRIKIEDPIVYNFDPRFAKK
jgi:RES domain-containing protein